MTEIDVPDWVVKAAEDARVHRLNAVTAYGSAGVDERYHMAMRAALTAALGAWVERAGFMDEEAEFLLPRRDRCVLFSQTLLVRDAHGARNLPLYTLRQEKPE